MNKRESKKQVGRPSCPNPNCEASHVVRNGSHRGRQRYYCRSCNTYFGATQGTPMYGLKTPAAEVAQALLIVMRRGSLRAAEEIIGRKPEQFYSGGSRTESKTPSPAGSSNGSRGE